ncbi:MAG: ParB N-terminal domain-containing protein [candidate division KSB1 bacterium]|nr:ParB N-terminal domain-containing protein [candidate division KSB1 bacterium]MDZ7304409.1 ParB N-terminal domain-containing protein [candidate division KSB1 bacterium]MDZ7313359.1 ParB N-terminal domain-containing protein [candidate division KSB1 bacterium]
MRIENIAIAEIDLTSPGWDDFIFTYPLEAGPLTESIRAVELQQPIVVAMIEEKYKIVIGVRRLLACKELGWKKIPALVQRHKTPEQLLWLSLQEKIGGRPLNAMEKSRVLQRFAILWHGDLERLQKEICPLIDLPPTVEAVETYLFFKEFPERHQNDLAAGRLTPQHAELLRPLHPEDRRIAAEKLFGDYRISLPEAREMIDNVANLAAREGVRVAEIFERPRIREIFVNENWTPRQRASQLRSYLQHERFPRLSEAEERFVALAQPLARHKISVRPPRFFEGNELTITVRASQAEEISSAVAAMQEATKRGLWKKFFALLQGEEDS